MHLTLRRQAFAFGMLALTTGLMTLLATAQDKKPKGEKYALLVGVRVYDPNELHDLPYAEPDIEELAAVLKKSGYRPENVRLMTQKVAATQPRFNPIKANIEPGRPIVTTSSAFVWCCRLRGLKTSRS